MIAEQARVLREQAAAIGELRSDVAALTAEVRELRCRLGRNSGSSSMAPSADDLPGRKPPEPKKAKRGGGRKPGGQPGSPGSHLAWRDEPDDTVPHFPEGSCACGADLAASMKTFEAFVFPDMDGAVIVRDRYACYDKFPGLVHQLCCQHLLRDLADAAETYPGAHCPVQIAQALQGLIHAASTARGQGLPAVPGDVAAPLIRAFRHGVILGLR